LRQTPEVRIECPNWARSNLREAFRYERPYREPEAAVESLITGFPKNLIHMWVLADATLYHVDFQLKDTLLRTLELLMGR
jgi:hypothetical protein